MGACKGSSSLAQVAEALRLGGASSCPPGFRPPGAICRRVFANRSRAGFTGPPEPPALGASHLKEEGGWGLHEARGTGDRRSGWEVGAWSCDAGVPRPGPFLGRMTSALSSCEWQNDNATPDAVTTHLVQQTLEHAGNRRAPHPAKGPPFSPLKPPP